MSKVCVDVARLPPLLSPLSHHTSRRCWLAPVMHLIWHALSAWETAAVPVYRCRVTCEDSFPLHLCIALRCVARDTETRTVFLFLSPRNAMQLENARSSQNWIGPIQYFSAE